MSPVVPKSLLIRRIQNELPIADDDDFRHIAFTDGEIEVVDPDTGATTGAMTWGEILEVVAGVFPLHPNYAPFIRYPMHRPEEWKAQHDARMARRSAARDEAATPAADQSKESE